MRALSRIARVECSTSIETAQIKWNRLMLNPYIWFGLVNFCVFRLLKFGSVRMPLSVCAIVLVVMLCCCLFSAFNS